MYRVLKRDGSMMEFHIAKIGNAITKAFEAVGRQYHPSVIELLALRVTAEFEPKIRNDLISVEDIQDCVERVYPSPTAPPRKSCRPRPRRQ